jgi:gamma-glutamylcyclotransferase
MNGSLLYFAYGSNLHPVRLRQRVPSARLVGVAELTHHALRFHKRGVCGSGKCNALYTGDSSDRVLGAVYEIAAEEKTGLDGHEGEGYEVKHLTVSANGEMMDVFAYFALDSHIDDGLRPFLWYRELVVLGARYHGFPDEYRGLNLSVDAVTDPMPARHERHIGMLERMNDF